MNDNQKTQLLTALKKHFGHKSFRSATQMEAIHYLVVGNNDGKINLV